MSSDIPLVYPRPIVDDPCHDITYSRSVKCLYRMATEKQPNLYTDPQSSLSHEAYGHTCDSMQFSFLESLPSSHDLAFHHPPGSRKRKRNSCCKSVTATPGGSPDRESVQETSPVIRFTGRKGTAYDIWVFIRAVGTDKDVATERWPNDYDHHWIERPDTPFIGCKLCSQFG